MADKEKPSTYTYTEACRELDRLTIDKVTLVKPIIRQTYNTFNYQGAFYELMEPYYNGIQHDVYRKLDRSLTASDIFVKMCDFYQVNLKPSKEKALLLSMITEETEPEHFRPKQGFIWTRNGTLNLKTGEFIPPNYECLQSSIRELDSFINYDHIFHFNYIENPVKDVEEKFKHAINLVSSDKKLADVLMIQIGSMFENDGRPIATTLQIKGDGGNGKGRYQTFLIQLFRKISPTKQRVKEMNIWGKIDEKTLLDLENICLIVEADASSRIPTDDEISRGKKISGGDILNVRQMYTHNQKEVTFHGAIINFTNHDFKIKGGEHGNAIDRRVMFSMFDQPYDQSMLTLLDFVLDNSDYFLSICLQKYIAHKKTEQAIRYGKLPELGFHKKLAEDFHENKNAILRSLKEYKDGDDEPLFLIGQNPFQLKNNHYAFTVKQLKTALKEMSEFKYNKAFDFQFKQFKKEYNSCAKDIDNVRGERKNAKFFLTISLNPKFDYSYLDDDDPIFKYLNLSYLVGVSENDDPNCSISDKVVSTDQVQLPF